MNNVNVLSKNELDVQIATAKQYPRNPSTFLKDAMEMISMDEATAASCFYCLPRGGSQIKGPSIRLAEIAASCWGNIHAATRIVDNDGRFITAQGVAWDLEKNLKISVDVRKAITDRNGKTYAEHMQVTTGQAACATALRNAILKVVPKAFVDRLYESAVKFAVGDQKTFSSRRVEVFARFNKMGIETAKILGFFRKTSIEEFDSDELATLIGVGTSIKDGSTSIDKAFTAQSVEETDPLADRVKAILDKPKPNLHSVKEEKS